MVAKNKIERLIISYRWVGFGGLHIRPQVIADDIESFLADKRLAGLEEILLILITVRAHTLRKKVRVRLFFSHQPSVGPLTEQSFRGTRPIS